MRDLQCSEERGARVVIVITRLRVRWEMAGAYDCDGPPVVLTFAVAGVVLGVFGVVLSARAWRRRRTPAAR